jgi:hypothetical protein
LRASSGGEDSPESAGTSRKFNLSSTEHTNFSLSHKHTGIHGDGQRIQAGSIDWTGALQVGVGLILTTPNGLHTYRIGVANNGALTATKLT